jgi:3-hydroxyacyl-CoA dehydrogenase
METRARRARSPRSGCRRRRHRARRRHHRAIFENLEAKQKLFVDWSARAPSALLATNTSSIPLEQIGAPMKDDAVDRAAFFNRSRMMLVEIVAGAATRPELVAEAAAFVRRSTSCVRLKARRGSWSTASSPY